MANNRMYLTMGRSQVLIAKGWGPGQWQVFDRDTLAERLQAMFQSETCGDHYAGHCCVDYKIEYEDMGPNVDLIAAAPEMLAALEIAQHWGYGQPPSLKDEEIVRAAIAKARGAK